MLGHNEELKMKMFDRSEREGERKGRQCATETYMIHTCPPKLPGDCLGSETSIRPIPEKAGKRMERVFTEEGPILSHPKREEGMVGKAQQGMEARQESTQTRKKKHARHVRVGWWW